MINCGKCGGSGYIPYHANYANGVCFQCSGTGKEKIGFGRSPNRAPDTAHVSSPAKASKEIELPTLGRAEIENHGDGEFAVVSLGRYGQLRSFFRVIKGRKIALEEVCNGHISIFGGTEGLREELQAALKI